MEYRIDLPTRDKVMSKLFISHATADRKFVELELLNLLKSLGFEVWFAEDDISTTEHWERSILDGLIKSDWFVLVMSPHSAHSEWVKDEISWAIDNRQGRIIPLLIEKCDLREFHIRLPRIQHIDFWKDPRQAREKLIKYLVDKEYQPHLRKQRAQTPLIEKAKDFWTPFSDGQLQIVMGRHRDFTTFEYSGFLGVGDVLGMTELQVHLNDVGLQNVNISFADHLGGDSLKTHMIILGGPDGNSITSEVVGRINSTLRFGNPNLHEIALYDSKTGNVYAPSGTGTESIKDDYAIIFLAINPFNFSKRLLLIGGSFGYATWAGVRFVLSNEFLDHDLVKTGADIECLIKTDIFRDTPQQIELIILREMESMK
jgi:hypothetical protein